MKSAKRRLIQNWIELETLTMSTKIHVLLRSTESTSRKVAPPEFVDYCSEPTRAIYMEVLSQRITCAYYQLFTKSQNHAKVDLGFNDFSCTVDRR
jgi:hypothetical protein